MSTTTEPSPTAAPSGDAAFPMRPAETAPSQTLVQGPALARMVGFIGLFALVLGSVVVVTNMVLPPRWITTGWGYLFAALGVALLMYHAVSDTEQEVRRMYGMLSAMWLVLALIASIAPGPVFTTGAAKSMGYNLLPWGVGFGFLSLIFAIPFARQETDEKYRFFAERALLIVGGLLAGGSLLVGVFKPDSLVGPGIALALLGLGFLAAYLGQVDTSEGIGYWVAFVIGAVGLSVALYAFGRCTIPTLLYDGPAVLRKPTGDLDRWKVLARLIAVAIFAAIGVAGWRRKNYAQWLRAVMIAIGTIGVIILLIASFQANVVSTPPASFLVPSGIILMGLGLVYLAVSLGICSDNQFVTLTRRELSAFFFSPIGYLVLGGIVIITWVGYSVFINSLASLAAAGDLGGSRPIQEPIVARYFFALFPVIAILLEVPVLTMGLLSDERRSGSLEVLLTAPVNELPVVLSKFAAAWIFFMISWLPFGLYLIALRVVGGQPFDYRPLLTFYVALAAQGLAFIAIGLFFSSLTRSQIVSAVLTLVVMLLFLVCYFLAGDQFALGIPPFLMGIIDRLAFINMWQESLRGQLPLRDTILFASLSVFFLYLSVKVLETRKWL
ncbi:MAG TPA: ABC transporter permease [Gemmataceae bacterium]|jgi:ABC-type transport system involved in multi-copper enzyme maturation permease subunit